LTGNLFFPSVVYKEHRFFSPSLLCYFVLSFIVISAASKVLVFFQELEGFLPPFHIPVSLVDARPPPPPDSISSCFFLFLDVLCREELLSAGSIFPLDLHGLLSLLFTAKDESGCPRFLHADSHLVK